MYHSKTAVGAILTIKAEELAHFAMQLAMKSGVGKEDASILAESLMDASLQGIDTHGISRLPIYLKRISMGLIDPKAKMTFTEKKPAVGILDAKNGLGQVAGKKAMDEAMGLAKKVGIGAVGVVNSQHFGAAGYYCSNAARQGFIGMAFTNAEPALPPWGSYQAFFGTNPISMGVPTGSGVPVIIDLSTSIVARGKIVAAARAKTPIPADWALDAEGKPTTDPQRALDGSVLTMSGPKGYALALMVDVLAGVVTGGSFGRNVKSMYKDMEHPANVSHMLIAIDVAAFMPVEEFAARMQLLIGELKASPKRDGVSQIYIPGERKYLTKRVRLESGIELDASVATELYHLAGELGVLPPF